MIQGNVGKVVVVPSENWYNMKQAAKILNCGMGQKQLYKFLRDENIIESDLPEGIRNKPVFEYEDKEYIRAEWREYGKETVQNCGWQVYISDTGIDFLRELIKTKLKNQSQ